MAVSKSFDVNGKTVSITIDDPDMPLLYALRDNLELHGPRFTARPAIGGPSPGTGFRTGIFQRAGRPKPNVTPPTRRTAPRSVARKSCTKNSGH
jgi:hypothetical protein